jgi:O-antigen ligase
MRGVLVGAADRGPVVSASVMLGALGVLSMAVIAGIEPMHVVPVLAILVLFAVAHKTLLSWPSLLAGMLLVILLIPIKRYSMGGSLPFALEPYRLYVALIASAWLGALLVDARVRFRASGLEAPLLLFITAALGSVIFNEARITRLDVHAEVTKQLTFFFSFVIVFYLIVSVVRTFEQIDFLLRIMVGCSAVVAAFAIVESRTGFNVFDHLNRAIPVLKPEGNTGALDEISRGGKTRVFGSAQTPIALGAAFTMLLPLGVYLGLRFRQNRWWVAVALLGMGSLATLSRTSILMLVVIALVLLKLRPREVKRFWPALLPLLLVVHFVMPGTIGGIRASFFPQGGLIAQQSENAGGRGSGRIADLGPALDEYSQTPLFGQGFGSRLTGRDKANAPILDDQWLKTLLETGLIGAFAWAWLYFRASRKLMRAGKQDDSERSFLFVALASSIISFAFGMFLYDAFSFIQATFLLFILLALGCCALAARDQGGLRTA